MSDDDYEDCDDPLYSDVPEHSGDYEDENVYSDVDQAAGEDRYDSDHIYDDSDLGSAPVPMPPVRPPNPPGQGPMLTQRNDPHPPPPPLSASTLKKPVLSNTQQIPLDLNSVRIKERKSNLKKVSILPKGEKRVSEVGDAPRFSQICKKFSSVKISSAPPPIPNAKNGAPTSFKLPAKNVVEEDEEVYASADVLDDLDDDQEEMYENPDELMNNNDTTGGHKKSALIPTPSVPPSVPSPPIRVASSARETEIPKLTVEKFDWYWPNVNRQTCEEKLKQKLNQDGTFLLRKCKKDNAEYAISLVNSSKIFHVVVRKRNDGKYSVGNMKADELTFDTIWDLVHFYKNNQLEILADESKKTKQSFVRLSNPLPK